MSGRVVALHGFLGCGADWQAVRAASTARLDWICPDLFARHSSEAPWLLPAGEPAWLLGYSYGARRALQLLADEPSRWRGAVLVSVNPGNFMTDAQRAERKQADRDWAAAFRHEDWSRLLARWNAQGVFAGSAGPRRVEADFDRTKLADALENFSVADQFVDQAKLTGRLVWMAGGGDSKFVRLLESMRDTGFPGTFSVVAAAGHRLLHDAPGAVAEALDRLTA
jgi:2-succinyl-6-hydroxy-2,4-cyclohexadiene-1-carboxylate synthase